MRKRKLTSAISDKQTSKSCLTLYQTECGYHVTPSGSCPCLWRQENRCRSFHARNGHRAVLSAPMTPRLSHPMDPRSFEIQVSNPAVPARAPVPCDPLARKIRGSASVSRRSTSPAAGRHSVRIGSVGYQGRSTARCAAASYPVRRASRPRISRSHVALGARLRAEWPPPPRLRPVAGPDGRQLGSSDGISSGQARPHYCARRQACAEWMRMTLYRERLR